MKYAIQLFSLLCFSLLTTVTMAQNEMFDDLFNKMEANTGSDTGGGASGLSGGDDRGSGGGGDSLTIRLDWAKTSSVLPQDYTLHWTGPAEGVNGYTVQVFKNHFTESPKVYVASVNSNSITIPFGSLNLEDGTEYTVRINSGADHKSKKGNITLVDKSAYNEAMKAVKADSRYQSGSKLEKILMKAWALEKQGLVMDAYKFYNKYMVESGDDTTLRNMKEIFVKKHR